ncbi:MULTISPECIES: hypothetical protein [Cyanophyceae]|nr:MULTISPECIES: hypothetical protein [Cyanophyceae]
MEDVVLQGNHHVIATIRATIVGVVLLLVEPPCRRFTTFLRPTVC